MLALFWNLWKGQLSFQIIILRQRSSLLMGQMIKRDKRAMAMGMGIEEEQEEGEEGEGRGKGEREIKKI
jgi:hypothetical protein